MGIILLLISAVLSTAASLVFVIFFANYPLILSFLIATLIWSPSFFFTTKALKTVKNVAVALVVFSVAATLSDTIGGIFIQKVPVSNLLTLILGLVAGVGVILSGTRAKEFDQPDKRREINLYAFTLVTIVLAIIFRNYWPVLVVAYAITDLFSNVLTLRLLTLIPEKTSISGIYEYVIGTIAFLPIIFAAILLLRLVQNVAFVGPASTIMSCGFAMVGSKYLTKKGLNLKDLAFLALSIICIYLIFISF